MNLLKPFNSAKNALYSMLSEEGKISVKRCISAAFAITVCYIIWFFLNKTVPVENQATLKYFFTGVCVMIALLTGVATAKDIIALKNGSKESETSGLTDKDNGSTTV